MEVGKSEMSAPFNQALEALCANNEYLAFAPDTKETRMMINVLSIKFPLLKVCTNSFCLSIIPCSRHSFTVCISDITL